MTVAAAVAVCRAIAILTNSNPQIKWVNDVYLNGKKICGILTEATMDFESQSLAVSYTHLDVYKRQVERDFSRLSTTAA